MTVHWEFKIVILGSENSGKTTFLLSNLAGNLNSDYSSSLGVNFSNIKLDIDEFNLSLTMVEVAANPALGSIVNQYFFGSQAAIIVYDVTRKESFDAVVNKVESFDEYSKNTNPVIMVIGNKMDQISHEDEVVTQNQHNELLNQLRENYPESTFLDLRTSMINPEVGTKVIKSICKEIFALDRPIEN